MTLAISFNHVSKKFVLPHEEQQPRIKSWLSRLRRQHEWRETFWALRDISFSVDKGESVGLIGSNGSGKSTALKLIAQILHPTSGEIHADGRIAALLELGAGFHQDLSGRDNIYLNASILGMGYKEIDRIFDSVVDFAELERFIDTPVKYYSSGMYARLAFAIAIHVKPDILLIDEALSVGDQAFQAKCMSRIYEIKRNGTTILLVSHDLSTVQSLCDRAIWLDQGEIQASGELTDVAMAYLDRVAHRENADTQAAMPALTDAQRWGSGKIRVTEVALEDSINAQRKTFVTGGTMNIRIRFEAEKPITDPIFGIAIHHENGDLICGPNSGFSGLHIPRVQGKGCVTYRVPSLNLLEGRYLLSVSTHNRQDTEMFDYHDRAYAFRVHVGRSRERYGLMTLNGEWRSETVESTPVAPELRGTYAGG